MSYKLLLALNVNIDIVQESIPDKPMSAYLNVMKNGQ